MLKQPTGVASVATDLLVLGQEQQQEVLVLKVSESAGTGSPIFPAPAPCTRCVSSISFSPIPPTMSPFWILVITLHPFLRTTPSKCWPHVPSVFLFQMLSSLLCRQGLLVLGQRSVRSMASVADKFTLPERYHGSEKSVWYVLVTCAEPHARSWFALSNT